MIYTVSKDGIKKILIYQELILFIEKNDDLVFEVETGELKCKLEFSFSDEGEPYTTTFWAQPENNYLKYQLNKWDSDTWVENVRPVHLMLKDTKDKFLLKFRNYSQKDKDLRKFELSIWKEVQYE